MDWINMMLTAKFEKFIMDFEGVVCELPIYIYICYPSGSPAWAAQWSACQAHDLVVLSLRPG